MKKHTIFSKIVSAFCTLLVIASVCLVVVSVVLKNSNRVMFIGGNAVMKIVTQSMEPTIPTGSFILLKKTDTASLQAGDVITFYSEDPAIYGQLNTHRIQSVTAAGFVTKGDNNLMADDYTVVPEKVVGRYARNLDFFAGLMRLLSNPMAYFVLIVLPILVLLFFSMRDVAAALKEKQKQDVVTETLEQMKQSGELEAYLQNSSANLEKDLTEYDSSTDSPAAEKTDPESGADL